ncbi:MAG: STAS domain-containing protein [Vicinamibacterales bacterium]
MQISEAKVDQVLVVGLKGRLDGTTSKAVEEQLLRKIDGGERWLVLDLAELEYISSVGLRVFMMAAKRLKVAQGKVVVCALTPSINQVFEIAGFLGLFPAFETRDQAVASLP